MNFWHVRHRNVIKRAQCVQSAPIFLRSLNQSYHWLVSSAWPFLMIRSAKFRREMLLARVLLKISSTSVLFCFVFYHFLMFSLVLKPVVAAVSDPFYKITSEALMVTQQLVKVIRPHGTGKKISCKILDLLCYTLNDNDEIIDDTILVILTHSSHRTREVIALTANLPVVYT